MQDQDYEFYVKLGSRLVAIKVILCDFRFVANNNDMDE